MKKAFAILACLPIAFCVGCQNTSSDSLSSEDVSSSEVIDTSYRIPGYNPYGKEYFLCGLYKGNNWNVFESFSLSKEESRYEIKKTFATNDTFMMFQKQKLMDGWVVNRGSTELDLNNGWEEYTIAVDDTSSPGGGAKNFSIKTAGTYVIYYFSDINTYNCPDTAFGIEKA